MLLSGRSFSAAASTASRVRRGVLCRQTGRWNDKVEVEVEAKVEIEVCAGDLVDSALALTLAFIGIGKLRSGAHAGSLATVYTFMEAETALTSTFPVA